MTTIPPIVLGSMLGLIPREPTILEAYRKGQNFHVQNYNGSTHEFIESSVVIINNTQIQQNIRIETLQKCIYRSEVPIQEPCFETYQLLDSNRYIRIEFAHTCPFQLRIHRGTDEATIVPIEGTNSSFTLNEALPMPNPPPKEECCLIL